MGRMSVATIDSPEFLNITSISPKISKCEVKVLYVGQNRNRSCITKEVATQMAKTLPGVPIVGYWCDSKEDFLDHGERIVIDGEGVKFQDMTRPYGFIAPDAKIWFQKFEDTDDFGNTVTREYLMTEGYLWTEQYEECKRIMEKGNPQSMKLDEHNLSGFWSTDNNKGIDFFIINDAMFENLCILGEEVEPCFEGANITAPKISSEFSANDNIVKTLFSMMEELKEVIINYNEGGSLDMDKNTEAAVVDTNVGVEFEKNENALATPEVTETVVESSSNGETAPESFAKKEEEKKEDSQGKEEESKEDKGSDNGSPVPPKKDGGNEEKEEEDDKEDKKKKYELLESEFAALQTKYNDLEAQFNSLVEFKNQIENEKKDALINSFYMLSDEDKADVIANKANYSLDDIEAKLSVICVRKKVNFDLDDTNESNNTIEANLTTFNLNSTEGESAPEWVTAMRNVKNK